MKNKQVQEKQKLKKTAKTEPIIVDIIPVRNEVGVALHIDVVLDNGTSFPIPNTKSALLHFRNIMLKQTEAQKTSINGVHAANIACKVITLVGAAGFVLVNTTQFGKDIGPLVPSTITGAVVLSSGIGTIISGKKFSEMQRNVTFACHKDEINRVIYENPYIYEDVDAKDKKLIELWLKAYEDEPIVIENLGMLKPETIQRIWKNIKLYKQFGFEYKANSVKEEPGFQKIKVPKDKKEQTK